VERERLAQRVVDPFGDGRDRILGGELLADDDELVAAEAAEQVVRA
jgi:hypothetical protein